MEAKFGYNFPAIKGIQAGREYYASMVPLRMLPRIFIFDEEELKPELRAQRSLNRNRLPEMTNYIVENEDNYCFSAITASIDGQVAFESLGDSRDSKRVGTLTVPMTAKIIINDGQHRRAAIQKALQSKPELGDETIAVVFFLDQGLERCQQMFADLNRHAIRPSKSLGVLYDHRDLLGQITKLMVIDSPIFKDVVEMERSSLTKRSRKLFTLSALYSANRKLLGKPAEDCIPEELASKASIYWGEVAKCFPEWKLVQTSRSLLAKSGEIIFTLTASYCKPLEELGGH